MYSFLIIKHEYHSVSCDLKLAKNPRAVCRTLTHYYFCVRNSESTSCGCLSTGIRCDTTFSCQLVLWGKTKPSGLSQCYAWCKRVENNMLLSTSSLRSMSVIFTIGRDSSDKHNYCYQASGPCDSAVQCTYFMNKTSWKK